MSDHDASRPNGPAVDGEPSSGASNNADVGKLPHNGFWWNLWLILKVVQARLRFVAILLGIGGLIAYWDTLSAYYDKWTRPSGDADAVSTDVEYFCPMHPFIV